jgi:hypothetical protein
MAGPTTGAAMPAMGRHEGFEDYVLVFVPVG